MPKAIFKIKKKYCVPHIVVNQLPFEALKKSKDINWIEALFPRIHRLKIKSFKLNVNLVSHVIFCKTVTRHLIVFFSCSPKSSADHQAATSRRIALPSQVPTWREWQTLHHRVWGGRRTSTCVSNKTPCTYACPLNITFYISFPTSWEKKITLNPYLSKNPKNRKPYAFYDILLK
jgi:hypothetical protein